MVDAMTPWAFTGTRCVEPACVVCSGVRRASRASNSVVLIASLSGCPTPCCGLDRGVRLPRCQTHKHLSTRGTGCRRTPPSCRVAAVVTRTHDTHVSPSSSVTNLRNILESCDNGAKWVTPRYPLSRVHSFCTTPSYSHTRASKPGRSMMAFTSRRPQLRQGRHVRRAQTASRTLTR